MTIGASLESPFDVIVIGGGVNGCGIARDCAARGLKVALFERRDFSTGATGASTGMIHGGLRYLTHDPDVTKRSCIDSGYIQKIAPHLIFRIPFLMPFRRGEKWARILIEFADIYFRTYDQYAPFKGGQPHCRLTGPEALELEPGLSRDVIGAVTTDEWGIDTQRISLINAIDARRRGAEIHNYHEIECLLRDGGRVVGVKVRDRLTGTSREVFARIVFNATGAWAERFATSQGVGGVRIRPGKGIHLIFAGRLTHYAIVARCIDGRRVLMCPHQNTTIVGPTDDDYYGDLDHIPILRDEVEYLLQAVEQVFPSIRKHRIIDTWAGCRPTIHKYGPAEDDLSRVHAVYDHKADGADGFMSIAGGKLAAFRLMSEDATDRIVEKLGLDLEEHPCTTHTDPLPGGLEHDLGVEPFLELGVDRHAASRILFRHGSEAGAVLDIMRRDKRSRRVIDPADPVTAAELRHVLRTEMVHTLDDATRRVRLGTGADQGTRAVMMAAQIFAQEKGLAAGDVPDIALHFLSRRFERRRMVVSGASLGQEELGADMMLRAAGFASRNLSFLVKNPSLRTTAGG